METANAPPPLSAAMPKASTMDSPSVPNRVTKIKRGTTAMSCNSKIEKVVRPKRVGRSPRSTSNCSTNAVEDSASPPPMIIAVFKLAPSAYATAAIAPPVIITCRVPRPNTLRPSVFSRETESSSPIMNNRNTTPSSASPCAALVSPIRPKAWGPIITPAARYPKIGLVRNRWKTGTTTTAAARKIRTSSRYSEWPNSCPRAYL